MKHFILGLTVLLFLFSCKKAGETKEIKSPVKQVEEKKSLHFPEELNKVFTAHGGYGNWNKMKQLSFTLPKKNTSESHLIALKSRKTIIRATDYTIGFNGKEVWMNKDGKFPVERTRFYHNLYFYFYAMPFILSDKGIEYEKIIDLEFEGVKYPGYKISYQSNIGDSPDDNYFVYYDKETFQMKWLGYTVTYGDDKPNTEIHYINYNDWETVNGLLLPKSLQWYNSEMNLPNEPTSKQEFNLVMISKELPDNKLFKKPTDALVGEK